MRLDQCSPIGHVISQGQFVPHIHTIPPVQERLTREIGEAVKEAITPGGVGVVIEAT